MLLPLSTAYFFFFFFSFFVASSTLVVERKMLGPFSLHANGCWNGGEREEKDKEDEGDGRARLTNGCGLKNEGNSDGLKKETKISRPSFFGFSVQLDVMRTRTERWCSFTLQ